MEISQSFDKISLDLSSFHLSFKTRGHVYSSYVRNVMRHASETWPLTSPDLQRLRCNDRAMIRQICNVKPENVATVSLNQLSAQLEIDDLDVILREKGFIGLDTLNDPVEQLKQFARCR